MCSICSLHTIGASQIKLETRLIREKHGQYGNKTANMEKVGQYEIQPIRKQENSALYEVLRIRLFWTPF